MDEILMMPHITNAGVFDSRLREKKIDPNPPRIAASFEIELPLDNGGTSYINNTAYPITDHMLLCAKPGQLRSTIPPFRCIYIHAEADGYLRRILLTLPEVIHIDTPEDYHALFAAMISQRNIQSPPHINLMLHSLILQLIHQLQQDAGSPVISKTALGKSNTKAIKSAVTYMDQHWSEKLSLADIAQQAYLSPIYFRTLFRDVMGMSPYEYLLRLRLSKSKDMLVLTDMSLSDIAAASGFGTQSYFSCVFKKEVGVTPKQYRVNANNQYP